ncbi:MAG: translation initiation factor IF-3, partial [bacterium]|nr:translation initiation factor IF-3 [bacterium]
VIILKENQKELPLINEQIRAEKVQLITHKGENIGVVSLYTAQKMAREVELDLVLLAEQGGDGVPVVKIMDFGKVLYERKKKKSEAKKHQKVIQIKEIKLRPKIGEHDYQTKIKQAVQFLKEGKRVKITLWFRGRESTYKEEHGSELFERVQKSFEQHGLAEQLIHEKDSKIGLLWSRIYYLKNLT